MRQATNKVFIEGILSENNLEYGSFINKDGKTTETIRGSFTVRVPQTVSGKPVVCEIPIHTFVVKYKKNGDINPAYTSMDDVKNNYVSIASAGSEDEADRVRISGAEIRMNDFYGRNGALTSYPRITTSFVNRVAKDKFNPKTNFEVEMYIAAQDYEVDAEGNEKVDDEGNKRYIITGIVPQYGDRVDVVKFVCSNENVVGNVKDYWEIGSTVKATGVINFTSTTETILEQQGFGEPIEKQRTITKSDLVITGGSAVPLDGDFAFSADDIKKGLAERKERIEADKARAEQKKATPGPAISANDLGF